MADRTDHRTGNGNLREQLETSHSPLGSANAAARPGGKLVPFVCTSPSPRYAASPDYRALVTSGGWDFGVMARLFAGANPDEWTLPDQDFQGMLEYLCSARIRGEFPSHGYAFHPLDALLMAHWSQIDLLGPLLDYATRQGKRAIRIIHELWLTKEVWSLVEAVNLSRGFPREIIALELDADACIAPELYDHVEALLEEQDLTILRDDGSLDFRRDDFLLLAHREGFWLPPVLRDAAEALHSHGTSAETAAAQTASAIDLPVPQDQRAVVAQYRAFARFYWSLFPGATPEEIYSKVMPFMTDGLGVDRDWFTVRARNTIHYSWLKGLNSRKNKPGPRHKPIDGINSSESGIAPSDGRTRTGGRPKR